MVCLCVCVGVFGGGAMVDRSWSGGGGAGGAANIEKTWRARIFLPLFLIALLTLISSYILVPSSFRNRTSRKR